MILPLAYLLHFPLLLVRRYHQLHPSKDKTLYFQKMGTYCFVWKIKLCCIPFRLDSHVYHYLRDNQQGPKTQYGLQHY
jgi:hypothetical protein